MGRSSIDLYSNDIGAPFPEIESFAAYVGGSPTNISVGAARLGLRSALLTGVGRDPVGDFVLRFLEQNGVETAFIVRKPGRRTSAVLLGIEPPDRFPLVFYRDNCADSELTIDDVLAAPLGEIGVFQFAGTNLSREPSRSATLFAAERAEEAGARVVLDLDFRPDQWHDARAFGVAIRSALRLADLVLGTVDEINAAVLAEAGDVQLEHSQVSDARVGGDVEAAVTRLLALGPEAVVEKRGELGARIWPRDGAALEVPGFEVEVQNILGAGDAFAAAFGQGLLQDLPIVEAVRRGTVAGALVASRLACSEAMPRLDELEAALA